MAASAPTLYRCKFDDSLPPAFQTLVQLTLRRSVNLTFYFLFSFIIAKFETACIEQVTYARVLKT